MTAYKNWVKVQLRAELKKRGLEEGGLKADLLRRLEEDDKKNSDVSTGGNLDRHGTNGISKDNAASSSTAEIPMTLQTLEIYLKDYRLEDSDQYSDSEMVQQLFNLVWYSRNIRYETFGAKLRREESQCDKESKAERSYDLHLKTRAADLAVDCSQTNMRDRSEKNWEHLLSSRIFRSFIQSADDKGYTDSRTHHCLACRCDFKPDSRPQGRLTRGTTKARGETPRTDIKYCTSTKTHFNLPNCDYQMDLAYYVDDDRVAGKSDWRRPDSTFGLCTYTLEERPWNEKDWVQVEMVKLFEKRTLKKTLDGFPKLREPYKISGTPVGLYSYPMFAFGLWEAKKDKDSSHENTLIQSSRELKLLLNWQRQIFDESNVEGISPTVWYFSSVGSDWAVYGCSETKAIHGDGFRYHLLRLWQGRLKDEESALQLLCIVDLIRFWVDYTYKPLIGACISRLEAMNAGTQPTPLDSTLWRLWIPIDIDHTPWFFSQRRLKVSSSPIGSKNNLGVPPHRRYRSHSLSSRQSLRSENQPFPRRDHRSPTPAGEQLVIPEKDDFNWLLDRDTGKGDLILIRVSETGLMMRPVIIYSTSRHAGEKKIPTVDWEDTCFKAVIADERRGHHPKKVTSIYREDQWGRDYLWQYYRGRLTHRGVQFSIIVPVDVVSYGQQNPAFQGAQLFEPLESLFRLQDLLGKIEGAKKKWCSCGRPRNRYSPPMVQCSNALCYISWFHKDCVNFPDSDDENSDDEDSDDEDSDDEDSDDEDSDAEDNDYEDSDDEDSDEEDSDVEESWLCDKCEKIPEDERAYIESKSTEKNVWYKHSWPSQDDILAKFDEVAERVDIIESASYTIRKAGVRRNPELPRYWAASKDEPKKLILARSRKESLLYHEAVSDEENEIDDTKNLEHFEEETDNYTDEDDEDGLSRPKTTKARGRSKSIDADQSINVETDTATGSEDDTLVTFEEIRTPNKTTKSGQSRQKPTPKVKHVQENRRSA